MTDSPDKSKLNAPESAIVHLELLDDIRHLNLPQGATERAFYAGICWIERLW